MARTPARAALASLARAASSTSASTSKSKGGKAAKPQPRRPTPAPASRPGDDFAPLFAGLVALCQAHEGARSAPARALLAALAAILDLCRRYLAAPTGSYLMDGCLDTGAGGGFAGLQLVAPAPAAPPPAAPRAPQAPVEEPPAGPRSLGEFHSLLASQVLGTIEELGELGDALDGADSEARQLLKPGSGATIASLRVDIEEARDHLRFALCSIAELSAAITGEEVGRSMAAHAAALARIELLSEAERGRGDLAKVSRKSALASFTDWLATPAPPSPQARATVGLTQEAMSKKISPTTPSRLDVQLAELGATAKLTPERLKHALFILEQVELTLPSWRRQLVSYLDAQRADQSEPVGVLLARIEQIWDARFDAHLGKVAMYARQAVSILNMVTNVQAPARRPMSYPTDDDLENAREMIEPTVKHHSPVLAASPVEAWIEACSAWRGFWLTPRGTAKEHRYNAYEVLFSLMEPHGATKAKDVKSFSASCQRAGFRAPTIASGSVGED